MNKTDNYRHFAPLFCYPSKGYTDSADRCREIIKDNYPQVITNYDKFSSFINSITLSQLQEYYIKTFDVLAVCYLDLGYVIFGDTYKRGRFLVEMQHEQNLAANDCGSELADHLPNILTLLPKIKDENLMQELSYSIVIPALKQICKEISTTENIFKHLLSVVLSIFENDFTDLPYNQAIIEQKVTNNFNKKKSCKTSACKVAGNANSCVPAGVMPK